MFFILANLTLYSTIYMRNLPYMVASLLNGIDGVVVIQYIFFLILMYNQVE